nr:S-layer homology domain-containing protein [uncultured Agathobaculum sp.]
MKQRMLSALLAASMVLTMAPAAFAADAAEGELENITWGENNTYELSADTTLKSVYTINGDTDAVYTIDLDTHTLTVDTIKVAPNNKLAILSSTTEANKVGTVAANEKDSIEFQVGGQLTLGPKVTFADPVSIYKFTPDTAVAALATIPQLVNRVATGKADDSGTVTFTGVKIDKDMTVAVPTIIDGTTEVKSTITVDGTTLTVAGDVETIVAGKDATIDVTTGTVGTIQIVEGTQPTITAPEDAQIKYEIVTANGDVKETYEVTMNVNEGGTAELRYRCENEEDMLDAAKKSETSNVYLISKDAYEIYVRPIANTGFEVESVSMELQDGEVIPMEAVTTAGDYPMTAPGSDATIKVTFKATDSTNPDEGGSGSSGGGSSSSSNKPSVSVSGAGGKVTASSNGTVTITPDEGYEIAKITVNGKEVAIPADGKLTGLTKNDKVVVTFAKITDGSSTLFADVADDAWYADAVRYVYEKGMMNGTSSTTFSPNETTTRAMIVTMLHRLENEPTASAAGFTDVASNTYYANAVAWAAANGVVTGVSETSFAPNDAITREQLAAILYRYAELKGYNVSASGSLSGYTDASQISSYATTAMQWANSTGLITGKTSTTLSPKGNATRAEVATILMRFCENIAK